MATNYVRKAIFKQTANLICRLCYKENKTKSHIISGCKLLDKNVPVNPNWQKHKPKPSTLITNQLLVTYIMTQEVESAVEANCPDIVILDEKECKAFIILMSQFLWIPI
eukprot:10058231-Ditylum_brightwellii.AAC.2